MTSDDRTPDTREVRDMYDAGSNLFRETPEQHYLGHPAPDYGAEFDRWLARDRREAKAEALDGLTANMTQIANGTTDPLVRTSATITARLVGEYKLNVYPEEER